MNGKNPTDLVVGVTYAPVRAYHFDCGGTQRANEAGCDHIDLVIEGKRQMLRLTGVDGPTRSTERGKRLADWTAAWLHEADLSVRCDRINEVHAQGHVWGTVTRRADGACLNDDLIAQMRLVA